MAGWGNYPGPMNYSGPHNEDQEAINYLESRYDQDPHNLPYDPDDYLPDPDEDFEPEYDDEGNEV